MPDTYSSFVTAYLSLMVIFFAGLLWTFFKLNSVEEKLDHLEKRSLS